jgi:hypothetical protein
MRRESLFGESAGYQLAKTAAPVIELFQVV